MKPKIGSLKTSTKWITLLGELREKDRRTKLFSLEILVVVQWLRFHACTAGGVDSIPGQGTKIPHAIGTMKKYCINFLFKKRNESGYITTKSTET